MSVINLSVQLREKTSKGQLKQMRREGRSPGVIYGGEEASVAVGFYSRDLEKIFKGSDKGINTLIEMQLPEGKKETVMTRELQRDPLTEMLLHADFYRVSLSERMTFEVPLAWIGESMGVKEGGILQPGLYTLTVECLPTQIPDRIEVSVENLGIGDKLLVEDLVVPSGVEVLSDPEELVVSILAGRVMAEETEEEEKEEEVSLLTPEAEVE
ncbi:MAG: 50S ribosomal protein L25 [Syntrophomonadaceae bacterium]|nr:50S ribosomal protein L25 [Syntrophomonadaceae bacterium]